MNHFNRTNLGLRYRGLKKKKKDITIQTIKIRKKKDYKVCVAACVNVLTKQLELTISSNQVVNLRWNRFVINVF